MTQNSTKHSTPEPTPEASPPQRQARTGSVTKNTSRPTGAAPLAAELRVAIMRTSRRLRAEAASHDISPGQYSVLAAILRGSMTVGQLAEREQIQAPSMTRIVNDLAAAGHVTRGANPLDKRQVLVQITDEGAAVLERARNKRTQWLAKRVAALTPEQRATLHDAALILAEMSSS